MPSAALLQIERRLAELACPPAPLRRKIRELAEHHDDLKRDALEEGLSETDAEARADERLGEPFVLADHLAAALRQSSWWGRHPIIGFCLLPLFAVIPLLMLGLWIEYRLGRVYFTEEQLGSLSEWETGLKYCQLAAVAAYYAALVSAAFLFCFLARRAVMGFRWAWIACAMCALHGAFIFITLAPHNVTIGFINQVHWLAALLPFFVVLALWIKSRRDARLLPPLPAYVPTARARTTALPPLRKTGFLTPTSIIVTLILVAIAYLIFQAYSVHHSGHAHRAAAGKLAATATL